MNRAVLFLGDRSIEVREVEFDRPRSGEISVNVQAAGVCHSDLNVYERGGAGQPVPAIMGHEASGIVEEVGDGVSDFVVGDHVVMTVVPQCSKCFYCASGQPTLCVQGAAAFAGGRADGSKRVSVDGRPIAQLAGLGGWAEHTVISADAAVKIDPSMPFPQACLLGCGVITGYGAAVNVADVREGQTVAVIGCGGVGLSGIQAARIRGAGQIIAIDVFDSKLDFARAMGATDTINGTNADAIDEVMKLTGNKGVDVTLDFVGTSGSSAQAIAVTRRGGQVVFTGLGSAEWNLAVPDFLMKGKQLKGNFMGMSLFKKDIPELVRLYQEGALLLDPMVTKTVGIFDVEDAFRAMKKGEVARSVIDLR